MKLLFGFLFLILAMMSLELKAGPLIETGSVTNAKLANNAVTSAKISDGTIASADISSGAVTTEKILDGTIASGDISTGAVTATQILDATITSTDISTSAGIVASQILDGTLTTSDLSGSAGITAAQILDGTLTTSDLSGSAGITGSQIANTTIDLTTKVTGVLPVANGGSGGAFASAGAIVNMTADTVSAETVNFINGNCTNVNPTVCTFTASYWSAAPVCVLTNSGTTYLPYISAISSSSVTVGCLNGGADDACTMYLLCTGAR